MLPSLQGPELFSFTPASQFCPSHSVFWHDSVFNTHIPIQFDGLAVQVSHCYYIQNWAVSGTHFSCFLTSTRKSPSPAVTAWMPWQCTQQNQQRGLETRGLKTVSSPFQWSCLGPKSQGVCLFIHRLTRFSHLSGERSTELVHRLPRVESCLFFNFLGFNFWDSTELAQFPYLSDESQTTLALFIFENPSVPPEIYTTHPAL